MIEIFYGEDRVQAQAEIKRTLGDGYEVIEGAELKLVDLPTVFFGTSLLTEIRKIVIKDLGENKECFEQLPDYVNTEHQVIIWENKLDKRTSVYKALTKQVKIREFKPQAQVNRGLAFDIYDMALRNGPKAARMLEQMRATDDPYQIVGAWSWKAIDNFKRCGGAKEKRALKQLSQLDVQMKTTTFETWTLMQAFLLQLS